MKLRFGSAILNSRTGFLGQKKFLIDQDIQVKLQVTCVSYKNIISSSALRRKVVILHLNKLTMPSLNNSVEQ